MYTILFFFLFLSPSSIFVQLPQLIKSPSIYLLCARVLKSATTYESRPILFLPAVLIEGARCFLINYVRCGRNIRHRTSPREASPEQRDGRGLNTRLEVTSGRRVMAGRVTVDLISVPWGRSSAPLAAAAEMTSPRHDWFLFFSFLNSELSQLADVRCEKDR